MTPYSSPVERARALYRIPGPVAPGRVLEVCLGREPLLSFGPRDTATTRRISGGGHGIRDDAFRWHRHSSHDEASDRPPPDGESFDLVVLHRTLEDLGARRKLGVICDERGLLEQTARLLAPGGLIAGSMSNVGNVSSIVWLLTPRFRRSSIHGQRADFSVRELGCLLETSGLTDVRIFRLLPDCDSPLKLVDIYPKLTRMMLRHELNVGRVRRVPFLLKRLAVELGIQGEFRRQSVFFWARKPC